MLFGIDAARRAIWRRDLKVYEAGLEKGRAEGYKKGHAEGYQRGYDARAAEESQRNGRRARTGPRRRRTLRDDH